MNDRRPVPAHPSVARAIASAGLAACTTAALLGWASVLPPSLEMRLAELAIYGAALLGRNVHVGAPEFTAAVVFLAVWAAAWITLWLLEAWLRGRGRIVGRLAGAALAAAGTTGGLRIAAEWAAVSPGPRPEIVFFAAAAATGTALACYSGRMEATIGPAAVGLLAAFVWEVAFSSREGAHIGSAAIRSALASEWLVIAATALALAGAWRLARSALDLLLSAARDLVSLAVGSVLLMAGAAALAASLRPAPPPLPEQAWGGSSTVTDKPLRALLAPSRPLASHELRVGTDGATYSVARLASDPPSGYAGEYETELRRRGVLMRPLTTSPYAPMQVVLGYEFVFLRRESARPGVILSRRYSDSQYPVTSFPWRGVRDAPSPLRLDGRSLILRLGYPRDGTWTPTVLVPPADVAELEEFAFPRMPASILTAADTRPSPTGVAGPQVVQRSYAVDAPLSAVLDHYEHAWRAIGLAVRRTAADLEGDAPAGAPMLRVRLEPSSPAVAPGVPVGLDQLGELAPDLSSMPSWPTFYRVIVTFAGETEAALYTDDARHAGEVAVLACGFSEAAEQFVREAGHVPLRLNPGEDRPEVAVWMIPVAGLTRSRGNDALRARLARHVEQGGALVVLDQEAGEDFASLPVPAGEPLEAWGWSQDASTWSPAAYAEAVYADADHPVVASLVSPRAPSNVDGHFERVPSEASVLLRRSKDGAPTMVAYRYGRGRVIISTSYDVGDVEVQGPGSPGVVRDALSWAAGPEVLPVAVPGRAVVVSLPVVNHSGHRAAAVRITVMRPARDAAAARLTLPARLEDGARLTLQVPVTLPAEAAAGLYSLDYALLDQEGRVVQRTERDGIARLAVSRPPARRYEPPDLTVAVMSPDGEDVVAGRPFRTRYVVENRSRRPRQVRVYAQYGPSKPDLVGPRTLAPGARLVEERQGSLKFGQRGVWIHIFEDAPPSGRCPSWTAAFEPSPGGCQADDGEGLHVRPPS